MSKLICLYDLAGERISTLCPATGRVQIGNEFFDAERTCHVIDANESGVGICDNCEGLEKTDNYCPNCGRKVVEL